MTLKGKTQVVLLAIFLIGLLLNLALSDILIEEKISADGFTNILSKISAIYSVHMAIIVAGFFISKKKSEEPKLENEKVSSTIIIALSICWNFLITMTLVNYYGSENTDYNQFIQRIDSISGTLNFLVAGGLTYYFGKST